MAQPGARRSVRPHGRTILELWVPAEELPEFNRHIVGPIRLTHTFTPEP